MNIEGYFKTLNLNLHKIIILYKLIKIKLNLTYINLIKEFSNKEFFYKP